MVRGRANILVVVGLLLILIVPRIAAAQGGNIAGLVRDSTGGVLPGVSVEATSPALIERSRTAVTDEAGQYRIVDLRPGVYTVTFMLAGFSTVRREGIELTAGFTAPVTAELRVGDVAETITVSGTSPLVDVQNVTQQRLMTRDVLDVIPSGRQMTSIGNLIPGVVMSGSITAGMQQDVGGQLGSSSSMMSIHGGRDLDTLVQVDGMSVSSPTRLGSSRIQFQDGNVEEYSFQFSSHSAETESGGIRVNLIPKEGGNAFRGGFFGSFGHESMQSNNYSDDLKNQGLRSPNRAKRLIDVNTTFGGPIERNRLWFFVAHRWNVTENYAGGLYYNQTPAEWIYTPDYSRPAVDDQPGWDGNVRLTSQLSPRNKVSVYHDYNYLCRCHVGVSGGIISPEASSRYRLKTQLTQAVWSSPLTNRVLLEAGWGHAPSANPSDPQPESTEPSVVEQSTGFRSRASSTYSQEPTVFTTARASMSYVTGTHAFKIGFMSMFGKYGQTVIGVRDVAYRVLNGVPNQVTYYATPYLYELHINPIGVFVQDQWTVSRLTLNGGLRFDYFRGSYPDAHVDPGRFLEVARDFAGAEVINWKDLNPRFSTSYDLFGTGKTAIKVAVNRYIQQEGQELVRIAHPIVASNNTNARTWTDSNRDFVVHGDPLDPNTNGELGPSSNRNFGKTIITQRFDPEWVKGFGKRTYNWETSAVVQHELFPRVSINAAYFRRAFGNISITDNVLASPSDYDPYCVTSPMDSRLPDGGGQRICGLFDISQGKFGQVDTLRTSANHYGTPQQDWSGADLTVNARVGRGTVLQGGLSTGKTVTDDCDVKPDDPNKRFCHTETPYLTHVKFLGAYTLPGDVQISGTVQSIPGPAIAASYTATNAVIRPSLGRNLSSGASGTATVQLIEPGTMYGDRLNQFDLRLAKTFRLRKARVQGLVDFYNLLNANPVLTPRMAYGTTGEGWLTPETILPARLVRIGAQVQF